MREISIIKENILQYLEFKGVSKYEFYKKTGVSNGVLSQKSGLSEENTLKFLSYYTDVNAEWLLTGKGEMLKGYSAKNEHLVSEEPKEEYITGKSIPHIPVNAMAGFGTIEQQILERECERYVVPDFKTADFVITVIGNSMQPKYNSGDVVACKKLSLTDLFFQWGKVYVLDTEQGPLLKRIKKGKDDDHILVVSDNPEYDPFELHRSKLNAIALVTGVIRLV